jgi:hypothetical protein
MITLGKPNGAATRAALAGIAAGIMIGLAACGNTVAGAGTSGPGAAPPGNPAGAPRATPRSSEGGVNPGGPMIPASAARVAMCRAVPNLTRMSFMLSTRPANLHVREVLPSGFTIRDAATVRQLATLLCALPQVPAGQLMCPNMMGVSYRLFFFAGSRAFPRIVVGMSGCRVVTGLGAARSWVGSTALEQALAARFGIHFPLPAY